MLQTWWLKKDDNEIVSHCTSYTHSLQTTFDLTYSRLQKSSAARREE